MLNNRELQVKVVKKSRRQRKLEALATQAETHEPVVPEDISENINEITDAVKDTATYLAVVIVATAAAVKTFNTLSTIAINAAPKR